ncbi:hypothetical protein GCM10027258_29510 [Amycolatopsis stemonae]
MNAASDPQVHGLTDALGRVYRIDDRPLAWLAIATTAFLVLTPITYSVLRRRVGTKDQALKLFGNLSERVVSPELQPFCRGRLAWGDQLVIQNCPRIGEGWRPEDILVIKDASDFRWRSREDESSYERWLETADEFVRRGYAKFRIMSNPAAFLDDPTLVVRVQQTKFSEALFVNRELSLIRAVRLKAIDDIVNGRVDYPNTAVLHLTVATRDGYLLLTRRSHKVAYHPGTWSCSIEEQLSSDDLTQGERDVTSRWVERALHEELGLTTAEARDSDTRYLGVFLETDILNIGLAALTTVGLHRVELESRIRDWPRSDYEFEDWSFFSWDDLARNLVRPKVRLHPSSGLRMFLSGLVHHGVHRFCGQVGRELQRTPSR